MMIKKSLKSEDFLSVFNSIPGRNLLRPPPERAITTWKDSPPARERANERDLTDLIEPPLSVLSVLSGGRKGMN